MKLDKKTKFATIMWIIGVLIINKFSVDAIGALSEVEEEGFEESAIGKLVDNTYEMSNVLINTNLFKDSRLNAMIIAIEKLVRRRISKR